MQVSKSERYDAEVALFANKHDAGAQAARAWLYLYRDEINRDWLGLVGDDLVRMQGAAIVVKKLIDLIDNGPKIKQKLEVANHG